MGGHGGDTPYYGFNIEPGSDPGSIYRNSPSRRNSMVRETLKHQWTCFTARHVGRHCLPLHCTFSAFSLRCSALSLHILCKVSALLLGAHIKNLPKEPSLTRNINLNQSVYQGVMVWQMVESNFRSSNIQQSHFPLLALHCLCTIPALLCIVPALPLHCPCTASACSACNVVH